MKLWPFKKNKTESEIRIRDGKILSDTATDAPKSTLQSDTDLPTPAESESEPDLPTLANPEPESDPEPVGEKVIQPESDAPPEPSPATPKSPDFYPPAEPQYNPSFLTDEPDGGDLGLYLHFLKTEGKKERTRSEYMIDLRIWKRQLAGVWPDAEIVRRITGELKPHRAHRLITALKSYGKYRNHHGDPRIVVMFATAVNLKPIKIPKAKKREVLTKEQLRMYQVSARELCGDGNRAGIWIGLSLIGVKSSEMRHAKPNGNGKSILVGNGSQARKVKAPPWLIRAMTEIPRSKWERTNNSIRKGLQRYGTSPHILYMSAVAHRGSSGNGSQ